MQQRLLDRRRFSFSKISVIPTGVMGLRPGDCSLMGASLPPCHPERSRGICQFRGPFLEMFSSEPPTKTVILERSASKIYRVTQRLTARSRRNPDGASLTHLLGNLSTTEARTWGNRTAPYVVCFLSGRIPAQEGRFYGTE